MAYRSAGGLSPLADGTDWRRTGNSHGRSSGVVDLPGPVRHARLNGVRAGANFFFGNAAEQPGGRVELLNWFLKQPWSKYGPQSRIRLTHALSIIKISSVPVTYATHKCWRLKAPRVARREPSEAATLTANVFTSSTPCLNVFVLFYCPLMNTYKRILRGAELTHPHWWCCPRSAASGKNFYLLRDFCAERSLSLSRHGRSLPRGEGYY